MTSLRNLDHLKAWQFRYWALLTGMTPSGRKAELQHALTRGLEAASLKKINTSSTTGRRVVSVDMGIRNLAYCVVDVQSRSRTSHTPRPVKVTHWLRRDLLNPAASIVAPFTDNEARHEDEEAAQKKSKPPADSEAFTPPQLSKTAYNVVTGLLSHKPDEILIERQRFRSGSASAILEWTIRVNMLESMLWASLETLRASSSSDTFFPEVLAIPPRRVAEFWLSDQTLPLSPPVDIFDQGQKLADVTAPSSKTRKARAKIEKKDKVALVKKWATEPVNDSGVNLVFEGQAAGIAEAFKLETSRGAKQIAGGKLDDLADCLLQAVAHLRWEENKIVIWEMLRKTGT